MTNPTSAVFRLPLGLSRFTRFNALKAFARSLPNRA